MPPIVIPENRAKAALQAGKLLLGTMLADIRQPSIMQVLLNAGFDYVIIDVVFQTQKVFAFQLTG